MLVSAKKILTHANKHNYAVPAFNINNLEILQAILDGCRELNSPVIIQTSEGAIEYAGMDYLAALVKTAARQEKFPIALHVDHGKDMDILKMAVKKGYTSLMYDGSALPFSHNVANTQRVVAFAKPKGVSVEGEVGVLAGIEDKLAIAKHEAEFTNPDQAVEFVKKTKVDSLAIAIGTSHGPYKFKNASKLNYKILREVKHRTRMPIVLHGASGINPELLKLAMKYGALLKGARGVSDANIKTAVKYGINKINIDSDLRIAFDAGIRQFLAEKPQVFDPRKILHVAKLEMSNVVRHKIKLFGSAGMA